MLGEPRMRMREVSHLIVLCVALNYGLHLFKSN
jgi:hypothetical protein